ncbi:universal stress protein (plasmid) [Halorussus salilacus]|uniref:universal stress protein n=1 Tax=Halorussus salilacus TaxID=2953750 RepID=UPI0020A1DB7D|nr:universal stress protein [Halorussus salilacus]USZ69955.1 universal stress protein [Halorussus salilacus]
MLEDILVPVDGSDGADAAIRHAGDIAERFGGTVRVLFVADTNRDSVTMVGTEVVDALEHEGERIVEDAAAELSEAGIDCRTDVVQGKPAQTIAEYADAHADLVVMPTHGRSGISRYLLGSVTEKVVRLSPVPVVTVRMEEARTPFPYEDVLVATDGSDAAAAAAALAVDIAADLDATLHVLSVADSGSLGLDVRSELSDAQLREAAEDAVSDVADRATEAGVENVVERVETGRAADEIGSYVDAEGVDLVAMGTTGQGATERILLGGVTEKLIRSSPVPVLTVRE